MGTPAWATCSVVAEDVDFGEVPAVRDGQFRAYTSNSETLGGGSSPGRGSGGAPVPAEVPLAGGFGALGLRGVPWRNGGDLSTQQLVSREEGAQFLTLTRFSAGEAKMAPEGKQSGPLLTLPKHAAVTPSIRKVL